MLSIDLNCDMGEGFGAYTSANDERVMPLITSANIACGFHASDPQLMARTVHLAAQHGVAIGAHPSYPDLVGFGRRAMELTAEEVESDVTYQVGALWAFCRAEGVALHHVKAHGALYNKAAIDLATARAIATAIRKVDSALIMVCLSNSAMVAAAAESGIPYVEEAFADRAYTRDGKLVPRSQKGAVLHDPATIAERVERMVRQQLVVAEDGSTVPLHPETICVHGDTPGSYEMLTAIRRRLEASGIALKAFSR
jgi:UPF0271 protein